VLVAAGEEHLTGQVNVNSEDFLDKEDFREGKLFFEIFFD
jgi:hypothetical protein